MWYIGRLSIFAVKGDSLYASRCLATEAAAAVGVSITTPITSFPKHPALADLCPFYDPGEV